MIEALKDARPMLHPEPPLMIYEPDGTLTAPLRKIYAMERASGSGGRRQKFATPANVTHSRYGMSSHPGKGLLLPEMHRHDENQAEQQNQPEEGKPKRLQDKEQQRPHQG